MYIHINCNLFTLELYFSPFCTYAFLCKKKIFLHLFGMAVVVFILPFDSVFLASEMTDTCFMWQ